jgi:glyoxylase-like metal-dependent hydrolase (beta-lactamase superfamily II)
MAVETYTQGALRIVKAGDLGSFGNNAYLIHDRDSNEAVIVDAPQDAAQLLDVLDGARVSRIIITHRHGDHWTGLDALKAAIDAPVACHEADRAPYESKVDGTIADSDEVVIGSLKIRAIHTPGHTPGSICFVAGNYLFSGDTLFPGGPGRTGKPEDLRQEIDSITSRLFELPDETVVLPGHGANGKIADSKREHAMFASKEHPADLCGDVTWEGS